ncbi:CapA family protein [Micromonospora polyrhachis]|uniref:Poly-gamma-glutamate synthesis protein (Capsule biosynthesis protein) n=1 Tax=Micromonospora polyrhachis TaxID=1282883 RepID=A0A7W7SXZ0_9ACTN|nr:CapA family protein [Micromonospora polyrhachis]MBB4962412.1 poly-gamma-glutamate synthesis protein (capsule biosynthesis protein) [Micromonospora polyrhachis]
MRKAPGITLLAVLLTASCTAAPDRTTVQRSHPPATVQPVMPRSELTIVAAGDLLVHPPLTDQAAADARTAGRDGHDFTQVLASVRPVVSQADLAICHMETPLAEPSGPFTGYPIFSVPPSLADAAAWAGFDTCSTASNHSLDTGQEGIARTLDNLDRVGLRHTGTARDQVEANRPNVIDVAGVKVAQLSYTFSFNGIPRPQGKEWSANLIDRDTILDEARRARQQGAEIVILSVQWGTEYQNEPDEGQLGLARELLDSPDIDLIVGHHVHVVQPFEKIGGKWVAYGIGNLTTRFPDGSPENTQDAVVPQFTFTRTASGRWEVTRVEVLATWMEYEPAARVVDLQAAVADDRIPAERRADYARIQERITRYVDLRGARGDGLRMRD